MLFPSSHNFNAWTQSQPRFQVRKFCLKKPPKRVLFSFEPALPTEEEIFSSLPLIPTQTCVLKHTGDLVKTRLVQKAPTSPNSWFWTHINSPICSALQPRKHLRWYRREEESCSLHQQGWLRVKIKLKTFWCLQASSPKLAQQNFHRKTDQRPSSESLWDAI